MKISTLLLAWLCAVLCACDRSPTVKIGLGDDHTWITPEETRRVADEWIRSRYPTAQIASELGEGQTFTYRFAANGNTLPRSAVVDRKTGKARFEGPAEAWYEHPSVTATEDARYLKEAREWHSDEYLRAEGPINLRYYVDPAMVDALPDRIKGLSIGMSEYEVERRLSQGYAYAWGFNTVSHGLYPLAEGEKPEEITFRYKLTEINADRSAHRSRFDLLIHWKCHHAKEGFRQTYLDARLTPARR